MLGGAFIAATLIPAVVIEVMYMVMDNVVTPVFPEELAILALAATLLFTKGVLRYRFPTTLRERIFAS